MRHPPIETVLEGLGTFGIKGRIDTLWAGIAPIPELLALQRKVDRLLVSAGLAPDARAYRPHVTLARFARGAGIGPGIATALPAPMPLAVRFDDVRLCESTLGREGAHYETIARYPLQ